MLPAASTISQNAEYSITLPAWLYHEISKPPVEDRIKCIDVDLVEATRRLSIWFEESIRLIGIEEDINCRSVTSDELIFSVVKLLCKLGVERTKQVGEGFHTQL